MDPVTLRIQAEVTDAAQKVQKLRQDYLNFAAEYKRATSEMQNVVNRFSGDAIIRQANQYVAAVQQIGGVSRLTTQNQQQLISVLQQAQQQYQRLGQTAPAAMNQILQATQQAVGGSGNLFSGLFAQITGGVTAGNLLAAGITKALSVVSAAVETAIKKTAEAFVYLVQRGGEVSRVEEGFQKLTRAAGQSADAILAAGRRGLQSLTNDFEIMQSANRAMLLGLEVTPEKFETLTRAAITLGRAMNINAAKALDDLTIALGRTSPRILDNLGIIVKIKDANEAYARSINKNVRELSAEEKQLAFSIMAMEKIRQKVAELGNVNLTLADRVQQMTSRWQNFIDLLAVAVAKSPVLNIAFDAIGKAIDEALGPNKIQTVQKLIDVINQVAIFAVTAAKNLALIGTGVVAIFESYRDQLDTIFNSIAAGTKYVLETYQSVYQSTSLVTDPFGVHRAEIAKTLGAIEQAATSFNGVMDRIRKGSQTSLELGVKLYRNIEELEGKMKEAAKIRVEETKIVQGLNQVYKQLGETQETVDKEAEKRAKEAKQRAERLRKDYEAFVRGERDIFNVYQGLGNIMANMPGFKGQPPIDKWLGEMSLWQQKLTERAHYASNFIAQILRDTKIDDVLKAPPVPKLVDENKQIRDYNDALKDTADLFTNLKQISGETWGGMMQQIAEVINLMSLGAKVGEQFRNQFFNPQKTFTGRYDAKGQPIFEGGFDFKKGFQNAQGQVTTASAIAGSAQAVSTGVAGFGAMQQATSGRGQAGNIGRGAMTGMQIGGSIVPGWGHLIGAAAGAIWGAVRGKGLRDITDRLEGRFAELKLSEDLAKQIEATSKQKFEKDKFAGEIFHTSDVVKEMGGVKATNVVAVTQQVRAAFTQLEKQKFSVEDTKKVVNENFAAIAEFYSKTGAAVSKEVKELIQLNKQFKLDSVEIKNFLTSNLQAFDAGIQKQLGSALSKYQGLSDAIIEAQNAAKAAQGDLEQRPEEELGVEDRAAIQQAQAEVLRLQTLQKQGATEQEAAVQRAGRQILATFNAAQQSGLGYDDALDQIGGSLNSVIQLEKDLGITISNEAVARLANEQKKINANQELVDGVRSYNDTLIAMSNLNAINAESFADAQGQAKEYHDQLIAAGFTEEETLRRLAPALKTILGLAAEQKLQLDDTTKGYIDQANAHDILKTKSMTQLEATTKGFKDVSDRLEILITTLGGKLPDAMKDASDSMISDNQKFRDSVNDSNQAVEHLKGSMGAVAHQAKITADEAINSFTMIGKAARDVQYDIDGVAVGHSPGGIKDWRAQLDLARRAMNLWRQDALNNVGRVGEAVDTLNMQAQMRDMKSVQSVRPVKVEGDTNYITLAPQLIDSDGFQEMMEARGLPHILEGLRNNRNGSMSRLIQLLGL